MTGSNAAGPTLRRTLGRWDLTAIGINQVIGSAIFLMPSEVAAQVGNWSPLAFVLAGFASFLVALCFAEVASRFEGTGGPYLYTRAAFGRFVGFEVGWMQWVTRVTSYASVINGVALALGFYWQGATSGSGRVMVIVAIMAFLALVNVRGIRQTSWVVNALTIGKLVPLFAFIAMGLFFIDLDHLTPLPAVSVTEVSTAALLLMFVFGGYDVIPVPAGEAREPRRHVPFALVTTILAVTAIMTTGQIVAMSVLPDLVRSATPLADAALVMMGSAGALMIGVGSVVSMTGNNAGHVLTGSRMLFALAEKGELPQPFGRIHPVFRTPANAVLVTTGVSLILALSGSFVVLAAASAVARLITYTGVCAATLMLRRPRFVGEAGIVKSAAFVTPLGATVPVLAILFSVAIVAGASGTQILGGLAGLAIGATLFWLNDRFSPRGREIAAEEHLGGAPESAEATGDDDR